MKRLNILSMLVAMALSVPVLTGCSDDDEVIKTPLGDPELTSDGATVSSLDFSWDKVDGATQYGYELTDPDGNVMAADVTTATSAHFTGLKEQTTYTLTVKAFANVNSNLTTSKIVTLTATTPARVPLDTPTGFAATMSDGSMVITWDAVAHASRYYYTYSGAGINKSSSTSGTKVTLSGLPVGDYTFTVYAVSSEEAYKESDTAQFAFTRTRLEKSRVTGVYNSALKGTSWPADLVLYDDGSYVIEKWYGVDGYDLEFSVNSDGSINVLNYTKEDSSWYYVPSGSGNILIYTSDGYSAFEEGDVWFYVNKGSAAGYDEFTWDTALSVNNLVGSYSQNTTGQEYDYASNDWVKASYTETVKITKVDDKTIKIAGICFSAWSITGTVDIEARTIYFAPKQMLDEDYSFSYYSSESKGVTATIGDDGTIAIKKWSAWYDGYQYYYNLTTTLTKE